MRKYIGMMEKYFDLKSEREKLFWPMENFVSHQFPSQCSGQLSWGGGSKTHAYTPQSRNPKNFTKKSKKYQREIQKCSLSWGRGYKTHAYTPQSRNPKKFTKKSKKYHRETKKGHYLEEGNIQRISPRNQKISQRNPKILHTLHNQLNPHRGPTKTRVV